MDHGAHESVVVPHDKATKPLELGDDLTKSLKGPPQEVWRGGCARGEGLENELVHPLEGVRGDEGGEEGEEGDAVPRRVGIGGHEGVKVRG